MHLDQAEGVVVLTEAHVSADNALTGLASLNVFRWRDESGGEGQDTAARLVNYLADHPGAVVVEVDGAKVPIDADEVLHTRGAEPDTDPLLALPTF